MANVGEDGPRLGLDHAEFVAEPPAPRQRDQLAGRPRGDPQDVHAEQIVDRHQDRAVGQQRRARERDHARRSRHLPLPPVPGRALVRRPLYEYPVAADDDVVGIGIGVLPDEQAQPLRALPVSGRPYLPADSAGREPGAVAEHTGEAVVALPGRGAGPVGRQSRVVRPPPALAVVVGHQGDALAECVVLGQRRALHDDEQPAVREPARKRPPGVESFALVENKVLHGGRPVCRQ